MKVLKIIGIIILVLVVLAGGYVLFGPSEGYLERSVSVNADRSAVMAEINNMKAFNKWSPWFALDENAKYEWEGPVAGLGSKIIWYSEKDEVGNGSMEIIEASENGVKYEMIFDEDNDGDLSNNTENPAYATLSLEEEKEGTKVTWSFEANMTGGAKFFLLMLESVLGPFYEEGLQNLKQRAENRPDFNVDIQTLDMDPISFIGFTSSSSLDPSDISVKMGEAYGKITNHLESNTMEATGVPLAVYTSYSEDKMDFICGIPVSGESEISSDELSLYQSYDGVVVKAVHKGDYLGLGDTHSQIEEFISYYGLEVNGPPWEDYPTDPMIEKDTSLWVTNVYYPVN